MHLLRDHIAGVTVTPVLLVYSSRLFGEPAF